MKAAWLGVRVLPGLVSRGLHAGRVCVSRAPAEAKAVPCSVDIANPSAGDINTERSAPGVLCWGGHQPQPKSRPVCSHEYTEEQLL